MSEPGFVYSTGYDENDHSSPAAFSRYARKELGVEVPVLKGRSLWYRRLTDEMESQGWDWDDLVKTVRYIKANRIQPENIFQVLYHVQKAQKWVEYMDEYDLHAKVADALAQEEDESWRRRLSLAQGRALEKVYQQWQQQHA